MEAPQLRTTFFSRKKQKLFINTALLQLEGRLISNLYLMLKCQIAFFWNILTLSCRRPLSYRNQSIDLQSKSVEWFLYDNGLRHERVKFIGLCYYLVVLNINFKIELAFQNTNIYRKSKFKGSGSSYKWKFVSSDNHG